MLPSLLDRRIVALSDRDFLTLRDLFQGLIAFGMTGSGKTSALLRTLVLALMSMGAGGLVLCAKDSDRDDWLGMARETGREQDVKVLSAGGKHAFDAITYLWSIAAGDLESVIDFIDLLLSIGRNAVESTADRFWEQSTAAWCRAAIVALSLAKHPVSMTTISRLIDSLPTRPGEHETESWQRESYLGSVLGDIRNRRDTLTDVDWANLDVALQRLTVDIPLMDERTRANVKATFMGMSDKFNYEPLKSILADGRCTFTPDDLDRGAIVVCDLPYTTYGIETSRLMQCGVKAAMHRGLLRREIRPDSRPVFIAADEAHLSVLPKGRDVQFQSVCRAKRVITLALVQSVNALAEAHGETTPAARTRSWLANLTTKIALRSTCPTTNEFLSDLVGKEWATVRNVGVNAHNPSFGEQDHLRHRLEPDEFTKLATPDATNPIAEAIVYAAGRRFLATRSEQHPQGLPYLRVNFSR